MRALTALLRDQQRIVRLRRAFRGTADVAIAESWADLATQCAEHRVSVVLLDLRAVSGVSSEAVFDEVRGLRHRHPALPIVLYLDARTVSGNDLFDAGRLGLDGLILAGVDDRGTRFRRVVEDSEAAAVTRMVRPYIREASPRVRDAILLCVARAYRTLSARDLARNVGIAPRKLGYTLAAEGFPTTRRLIAWGRLIMAGRLLEDPDRPANLVARALHYPSGSAMRNACQRYVHAAPNEIRELGGARYILEELLAYSRRRAPRATPEDASGIMSP